MIGAGHVRRLPGGGLMDRRRAGEKLPFDARCDRSPRAGVFLQGLARSQTGVQGDSLESHRHELPKRLSCKG
jgi:hypothetical protein